MRRLFAFGLGLLAACESVSSEKIEQWKGTEKGPPKIAQALGNSGVAPGLRAEAAAALVELGMSEKVDEVMATLPANERWEIIKSLVPVHVKAMESAPVPAARDARDALFSVRPYAQPEQQKQIDAAILTSVEKDVKDGRFTGGRHSLDKMLVAIGTPSGPMLVKLLADPKAPYKGLAELLLKVGDESAREFCYGALAHNESARAYAKERFEALRRRAIEQLEAITLEQVYLAGRDGRWQWPASARERSIVEASTGWALVVPGVADEPLELDEAVLVLMRKLVRLEHPFSWGQLAVIAGEEIRGTIGAVALWNLVADLTAAGYLAVAAPSSDAL